MATKQKISEFREFVEKKGKIEDPEHMPQGWNVGMHMGKCLVGIKLENAFDIYKVNERLEEIRGELESRGIKICPSYMSGNENRKEIEAKGMEYIPMIHGNQKLYAINVLKMAEDQMGFSHYTRIELGGVNVTLDEDGIRILGLLEKCLIEDKMEAAPAETQTQKKILIVDDEECIPMLLGRCLKNEYDVKVLKDSEEALKELISGDYDLLISDHSMPKMCGDVLINKIKEIKPGIKTIIMSGGTFTAKDKEGNKNIDVFVEKPFTIDEIKQVIKGTVG